MPTVGNKSQSAFHLAVIRRDPPSVILFQKHLLAKRIAPYVPIHTPVIPLRIDEYCDQTVRAETGTYRHAAAARYHTGRISPQLKAHKASYFHVISINTVTVAASASPKVRSTDMKRKP